MSMRFELLKASVVATFAVLDVLGRSPVPTAGIVALAIIELNSFLGCALAQAAAPRKQKSMPLVATRASLSANLEQLAACIRLRLGALTSDGLSRTLAWSALAILFAQAVRVLGLD